MYELISTLKKTKNSAGRKWMVKQSPKSSQARKKAPPPPPSLQMDVFSHLLLFQATSLGVLFKEFTYSGLGSKRHRKKKKNKLNVTSIDGKHSSVEMCVELHGVDGQCWPLSTQYTERCLYAVKRLRLLQLLSQSNGRLASYNVANPPKHFLSMSARECT